VPVQSDQPLTSTFMVEMPSPSPTSLHRDEQLEVSREYVELLSASTSPEPVTSTGDGSASITIQGEEGASPAIVVLAFVAPLLIVALALGGVYQLFRWIERRRG
jgi:hypothetical protein